jgi:hypothetical protein
MDVDEGGDVDPDSGPESEEGVPNIKVSSSLLHYQHVLM